jgi:hypothetical protein
MVYKKTKITKSITKKSLGVCTYCLGEFKKKDLRAAMIRMFENDQKLEKSTYFVAICQKCSEIRADKILELKEI